MMKVRTRGNGVDSLVGFAPPFTTQGSPELIAKYGELIAHVGILGSARLYIRTYSH